jgi:hypothetical protein
MEFLLVELTASIIKLKRRLITNTENGLKLEGFSFIASQAAGLCYTL